MDRLLLKAKSKDHRNSIALIKIAPIAHKV